jgi:endonuclease YncB( thermonuclease family)
MRDEFLYIMNGSKDQKTDWVGIWEEQYQRSYGPLDWTAPEPASPFDENGDVSGATILPQIRQVVDGDTLLIKEYKGSPTVNSVRILGVRADELSGPNRENALDQTEELENALLQAVNNGDNIYLVRDTRFGNTDRYGRMLAWLWIGDQPFYKPEDLMPNLDPTGGDY